jgi:hypothetical protein
MSHSGTIAIGVLSWLAGEPELFNRFVGLSGLEASQIRDAATEPGFLAGVLEFLINHEPTLNRYCEHANEKPENIARAFRELGGHMEQGY